MHSKYFQIDGQVASRSGQMAEAVYPDLTGTNPTVHNQSSPTLCTDLPMVPGVSLTWY